MNTTINPSLRRRFPALAFGGLGLVFALAGCGEFYPKAKEPGSPGTSTSTNQEQTTISAWDSLATKSYTAPAASLAAIRPLAATVVVTPKTAIQSKTSIMYRLNVPMKAAKADGSIADLVAAVEFKLKGKLDMTFSSLEEFPKDGDCRYDLKRSLGKCALMSAKKSNAWQVDKPYTVSLALIKAGEDAASGWQLHTSVADAAGAEVAKGASPVVAMAGISAVQFAGTMDAAILSYKAYPDCSTVPDSGFQLATPTMLVAGGGDVQKPLTPGKATVHGMCKTKSEGNAVVCDDAGCTLAIKKGPAR